MRCAGRRRWFLVSWPRATRREVMPCTVVRRKVARVSTARVTMARKPRGVEQSVDDDGQDQQRGHAAPEAEVAVGVPAVVAAVVTPEHSAPHTNTATLPGARRTRVTP